MNGNIYRNVCELQSLGYFIYQMLEAVWSSGSNNISVYVRSGEEPSYATLLMIDETY